MTDDREYMNKRARVGMPETFGMVEVRMTRQQAMALLQLVLERQLAKEGTREWIDGITGTTVTIEDLLALLSLRI